MGDEVCTRVWDPARILGNWDTDIECTEVRSGIPCPTSAKGRMVV